MSGKVFITFSFFVLECQGLTPIEREKSLRTDTSISFHVLESSTVKLCKGTLSRLLDILLVIFLFTPSLMISNKSTAVISSEF